MTTFSFEKQNDEVPSQERCVAYKKSFAKFRTSPGAKYFFWKICCTPSEKVIFAFERSYITYSGKLMMDIPVPGSF